MYIFFNLGHQSTNHTRSERDAEKRLRLQAENDARRAKAAADQAAAAAAEASRSLKLGEKQNAGKAKEGEVRDDKRGVFLVRKEWGGGGWRGGAKGPLQWGAELISNVI